jgi:hypothetical protein
MWRFLIILAILTPCAGAESLKFKHAVDVNGDGTTEYVGLREYESDGLVYGRLVLTDSEGVVVWEAPVNVKEFRFLGEFDAGGLEAAYRTQDGQVFLLGSYQKSDVRPTRYRIFTWHDRRFVHLRDGDLLPAPQRPATFVWSDDPGAARWVEEVRGADENGDLKALVTDLKKREREEVVLRPNGLEYVLVSTPTGR